MNKAKMTFRFSHERRQDDSSPRREVKVIPLHAEEYRVVQEPETQRAEVPLHGSEAWTETETETGLDDKAGRRGEAGARFGSGTETNGGTPFHTGQAPSRTSRTSVKPAGRSEFSSPSVKPLNDFTTDFGGWQSSFDLETERVEQIIRSAGGPAADPETGYFEREPRPSGGRRSHRGVIVDDHVHYSKAPGGGSFLKITASVAGAVITGVAFGFLVLSMFSGGEGSGTTADPTQAQASAGGAAQPQNGDKADASGSGTGTQAAAPAGASVPAAAADGVAIALPAASYTFLQGGVFSTAQSAETAVADFRKKGLAAVSEAGDKYTVYVGMASGRDEALGLSQVYEAQDIDVMLKPYDIPAVSKIRWNGKQADIFGTYMNQGTKLVQLIAAQTAVHAGEQTAGALDEKALQTIKTTHQSWSQSAASVSDGLGEAGKAALPKMNSALNTAVASMEEYKKNPSAAFIWQAQTSLMQYLVAEKELLKAIVLP
ncbi:SPOR domain-containing protein [Paenibacillus sp. tmac-D7]|uniref:SPOR domain-containing protein n=1 Tax=Paenibacillus sp. tmac-D7 TaxID=2591462 RepID=UPI00114335F8|nr:SPOR domain-containing protein [Paenibacillus sp. tmac-D7]